MDLNSVSDQNKCLKLSLSGSKPEAFIQKSFLFNETLTTAETKRNYKFIFTTHHWPTYLNPSFLGAQERVESLSSSFAGKETVYQEATPRQCNYKPLSGVTVTFSEAQCQVRQNLGSTQPARKHWEGAPPPVSIIHLERERKIQNHSPDPFHQYN